MRALYVYVPVVHEGIRTLFESYKGTPIWLLDNIKGREENVYLERDIRALPASDVKIQLEALGFSNVKVVDQQTLKEEATALRELLVPRDEIVLSFVEKYAKDVHVEFIEGFLRWTKPISTTEFEIPADRTITRDTFARGMIATLTEESKKSSDWWRQIAAALVKDSDVILTAHNKHFPTPHAPQINGDPRSNLDAGQGPGIYTSIHAEASLIAEAAKLGIQTDRSDLYVTTFPCPACARLAVVAGIKRVFYAKGYSLLDAESILKQGGVEIVLVKE